MKTERAQPGRWEKERMGRRETVNKAQEKERKERMD